MNEAIIERTLTKKRDQRWNLRRGHRTGRRLKRLLERESRKQGVPIEDVILPGEKVFE